MRKINIKTPNRNIHPAKIIVAFMLLSFLFMGSDMAYGQRIHRRPPKRTSRKRLKQPRQVSPGKGELTVEIWKKDKAYNGTTLFADLHDRERPRILEVDMEGRIVWEYVLPDHLKQHTNPGFDVEWLPNGNVLFVAPGKGIYEVNRNRKIVWSHQDSKVSHDADRLPNGNTIYVFGDGDKHYDDCVKEINAGGKIVWSWSAKNGFYKYPYKDIEKHGWVHANAVTRLSNGNTVVSLRNFQMTVEVDPQGEIVWLYDWSAFGGTVWPHEPEIQANGNILIALQDKSPYQVAEINRKTGQTVWTFSYPNLRTTRDADRLPNGNTLLVSVISGEEESVMIEVTPEKEIVWKLRLKGAYAGRRPGYFYKAERR